MKLLIVFCVMVFSLSSFAAGRCADLTGKKFLGAERQGGESHPGCEGCGNPGLIMMESATDAAVNWVGSDIIEMCKYKVNYPTVTLTCQYSGVEKLRISKSCNVLKTGALTFTHKNTPQP